MIRVVHKINFLKGGIAKADAPSIFKIFPYFWGQKVEVGQTFRKNYECPLFIARATKTFFIR